MPREPRRPPPALTQPALERLALRYVERFATTRAKLLDYLRRKLRERGSEGVIDPEALADRMVELRYVDDLAFAESRVAAMARRGLGPRRVRDALRHAGVAGEDSSTLDEAIDEGAEATAMAFARRRRIGPFAPEPVERDQRERQIAAMVRAGHAPSLARRIASMTADDVPDLREDHA
ncbi:RecX family transcriptional regulator [Sphingomonas sp. Leaf407]|uniref:regulatory protein RecX n=1 Tax=unclassified Sphingomonas TaxID=196159 RepID=UPI0006F8E12D|nr:MULTISPECIES: RecX family transcriptional regulator [unclassified Sphingomonas]KQN40623.1 RecX family transcriptional regulator [Sphingomonas sp. Leaf42]KQT29979.1 RecX family transcriptional regulator [Sphingomonas sp. Leaf407]